MINAGDTARVLVSAALVLFMTVGLAFFYGGLEPRRNVLHMVAMNMFTIAIVTITLEIRRTGSRLGRRGLPAWRSGPLTGRARIQRDWRPR